MYLPKYLKKEVILQASTTSIRSSLWKIIFHNYSKTNGIVVNSPKMLFHWHFSHLSCLIFHYYVQSCLISSWAICILPEKIILDTLSKFCPIPYKPLAMWQSQSILVRLTSPKYNPIILTVNYNLYIFVPPIPASYCDPDYIPIKIITPFLFLSPPSVDIAPGISSSLN